MNIWANSLYKELWAHLDASWVSPFSQVPNNSLLLESVQSRCLLLQLPTGVGFFWKRWTLIHSSCIPLFMFSFVWVLCRVLWSDCGNGRRGQHFLKVILLAIYITCRLAFSSLKQNVWRSVMIFTFHCARRARGTYRYIEEKNTIPVEGVWVPRLGWKLQG